MLDSSKATVGRLAALPTPAAPVPSSDKPAKDLVVSIGWGSQKRLDEVYGAHGPEVALSDANRLAHELTELGVRHLSQRR